MQLTDTYLWTVTAIGPSNIPISSYIAEASWLQKLKDDVTAEKLRDMYVHAEFEGFLQSFFLTCLVYIYAFFRV